MRTPFVKALTELAERDSRVLLLTADLGYLVLDPFVERFPNRFLNIGVAEQNMIGVATGLAEAGFIPFVYSIVPFAVLRPYEFIRNGPVQHRLPVRIVGVGEGLEYGHDGLSHYALEDIGAMRLQPELAVIAPADYQQAQEALIATWDWPGPVYYRLGKNEKDTAPGLDSRFEIGRAQFIGDGGDLLIVVMGSVIHETMRAVESLTSLGVSCTVMVVASVSPAPLDDLADALARFHLALTVEAHYVTGGLGSLVSEVIAERGLNCRLVRCGMKTMPDGVSGSQGYLYQEAALSADELVKTALFALNNKPRG